MEKRINNDKIEDDISDFFESVFSEIERRQLISLCKDFDIDINKDNYNYCISIKMTYNGFLTTLYGIADRNPCLKNPEEMAFLLTGYALGLFKKNRLPEKVRKMLKIDEIRKLNKKMGVE